MRVNVGFSGLRKCCVIGSCAGRHFNDRERFKKRFQQVFPSRVHGVEKRKALSVWSVVAYNKHTHGTTSATPDAGAGFGAAAAAVVEDFAGVGVGFARDDPRGNVDQSRFGGSADDAGG